MSFRQGRVAHSSCRLVGGKIRPQLPSLLQPKESAEIFCQNVENPTFIRFSINPNLQHHKFATHRESLTPKTPQVPHFKFWVKKSLTASLTCNPDNAQGVSYHFPRNRDEGMDRIGWVPSQKFRKCHMF